MVPKGGVPMTVVHELYDVHVRVLAYRDLDAQRRAQEATLAETRSMIERTEIGLVALREVYDFVEDQCSQWFGVAPKSVRLRIQRSDFDNPCAVSGQVIVAGLKLGVRKNLLPVESHAFLTRLWSPGSGVSDRLLSVEDAETEYVRQHRWFNMARFWRG